MKYIDAEKLIAEIERRIAAYQKNFDKADNKIAKLSTDGRIAGLKGILPFITSLQQEMPEVDFETEYAKFTNDPDELEYAFPIDLADYKDFAYHFFELGRLSNK